ncbi:hypothetical protein C8Q80DRAFT_1264214 [Daedaleopsis nitida]|nr:hypothetical protein C8Q80DRAFT_1264214 [Daedaleopsis nitida]
MSSTSSRGATSPLSLSNAKNRSARRLSGSTAVQDGHGAGRLSTRSHTKSHHLSDDDEDMYADPGPSHLGKHRAPESDTESGAEEMVVTSETSQTRKSKRLHERKRGSDVKEEDYDFAIPKAPSRRKYTQRSMSRKPPALFAGVRPEDDKELKPNISPRQRASTFMESVVIPRKPKLKLSTRIASTTQGSSSTAGPSKDQIGRRAEHSHASSAATASTTKVGRSDEERRPKRPVSPTVGRSPPTPPWLDEKMSLLKQGFPSLNLQLYVQEAESGPQWGIQCIFNVGPGSTLNYFMTHLRGGKHYPKGSRKPRWSQHASHEQAGETRAPQMGATASQAGRTPTTRNAPPSAAQRRKTPAGDDAVERFLDDIGLSVEYADALRHVGINDDARIQALGRLSDANLDRLEKSLADEGLDFAACLLVREGLQHRAKTA